ncbi:MAG: hypothetical protein U0168_06185 [Nannocystaceae bacterium]
MVEEGDAMVVRGGLFVRGKNGVAGALLDSLTALAAVNEGNRDDAKLSAAFG